MHPPDRTQVFEHYRPRLFGIAYRMLGTVEDAEDLVQEAYLRWHETDEAAVRSPEAWLVAVVTRLSIDRLRRAATERAAYVGQWLPEPYGAGEREAPDRPVEIASDLSMAFLVLLERLSPEERAAFLLREVFNTPYSEIAQVLNKGESACRQIVHRARERVRGDRPRFPAAPEAQERLLHRFISALTAGNQGELLALVGEGATWTADGGGKVSSTIEVVRGADRIVRMLLGWERKGAGRSVHRVGWVNGEPAIITSVDGQVFATTSVETDADRILAFYRVLNPEKLRRVT